MKKRIGIVGAGILGLAVACKTARAHPDSDIVVFEKESAPGKHQSTHNSGVLHCGLPYAPGSLKARLAVEGIREMVAFCRHNGIDHELCGKVVVANGEREDRLLVDLARRGEANGLSGLSFLDSAELGRREPHVRATTALLVPEEGIVDYSGVIGALAKGILDHGGRILCNAPVRGVSAGNGRECVVRAGEREFVLDVLVNCAGLHADRVYRACCGKPRPLRIVPFRGEYLSLKPEAEALVRHLVYPVPDPAFPFLGVHFTRMIGGGREVGPNAVLAFKREGYSRRDISLVDTFDIFAGKGFRRFLAGNFRFAAGEFSSSLFMASFLAKARKLIPEISSGDLVKGAAGVRAQAIDDDGALAMDFRIVREGTQVHVLNAPSPAATASLAIAGYLVENFLY